MNKLFLLIKQKPLSFAISGIIFSLVSFYFVSGYSTFRSAQKRELEKLETLVKKESVYLDEEMLAGAKLGDKIYSVFKTDEGEFALVQVVKAKVSGGKFEGEVTVRFTNGDLYSGNSGEFVPEVILRDGTKLPAQIVENALATLDLSDGRVIAIEVADAEILDGGFVNIFAGRGINTG